MRTQGREEDRGHYVCSLKFRNGVTLKRTVDVHVLQSKSKQNAFFPPNPALSLHSYLSFTSLFFTYCIALVYLFDVWRLCSPPNCHS